MTLNKLSDREKLYLLINSLVEKCESYSGRNMYGAECPGFVYTSINEFLRDSLLSVIDLPDEDEAPDSDEEFISQEEFINLVSRFKWDSAGTDLIIYFPEIVLTPELKAIIKDNSI